MKALMGDLWNDADLIVTIVVGSILLFILGILIHISLKAIGKKMSVTNEEKHERRKKMQDGKTFAAGLFAAREQEAKTDKSDNDLAERISNLGKFNAEAPKQDNAEQVVPSGPRTAAQILEEKRKAREVVTTPEKVDATDLIQRLEAGTKNKNFITEVKGVEQGKKMTVQENKEIKDRLDYITGQIKNKDFITEVKGPGNNIKASKEAMAEAEHIANSFKNKGFLTEIKGKEQKTASEEDEITDLENIDRIVNQRTNSAVGMYPSGESEEATDSEEEDLEGESKNN